MSKTISEKMEEQRKRTKDVYINGIGTPNTVVEQRADNTASDAIALWIELLEAGKNGISFETWLRKNNKRVIAACAQRHA